ncbi:MAG: PA0069 family radical SAM protein [Crocinitomicaceae bacterium]
MTDRNSNMKIKGRGAQVDIPNRFNKTTYHDHDLSDFSFEEEEEGVQTNYLEVHPKSLVNPVPSKDIYLNWSMNPYQGCEHGCAYCYARPTHEYWGYNSGLDFERTILYKPNAPELLKKFLDRKSWIPEAIMLSGNTDCYQPAERKYEITRKLLQVLRDYNNPVGIITKNSLIIRDIDLLKEMADKDQVAVNISLTTLDEELRRKLEPRTSTAVNKLKAIEKLSAAGIHTQVMIRPVIPGLNSHEIPEIIRQSADAGAIWANYINVRLNGPLGDIFTSWLKLAYPDRVNKVLNQIKESNGGVLSNTIDGGRMRGNGINAKMIRDLFEINRSKYMTKPNFELNTSLFARPGQQLNLF